MYRIERISLEKLKDLSIIFKAINKVVSVETLIRKFRTEAFGASYIGYIAYSEGGEPSAFYGVFPIIVSRGNEKILTAQSGDTVTHPNHQGKGLFTKLAGMTYELAKQEGIKLVWGFPNKNSYHGFTKKLNWTDNEILIKVKVRVRTIPIAKVIERIKIEWPKKMYAKICNFFFKPRLNQFIKVKRGDAPFILKDLTFFEYKNYNERLVIGNDKNKVWCKVEGSLMIGDIEYDSLDEFKKLWSSLKSKCRWLGITEIIFICNYSNPNKDLIKKIDSPILEESLSYCHLAGWDDELAKSMSICLADFDTF
ncbi:MAG: GNAT family N-acetyltransferase [Bacteroidia bacterium]